MLLRFHFQRTLQAVAEFLEASPGRRMNYMRLLKLLYIAERELLAEHALPITGDQAVAMERGPVLSHTYDLILGKTDGADEWGKFIHKDHYDICLVNDPGRGQLSKSVLAKLHEVARRYEDMDEWDMVEETHKFAEWKKNFAAGSKPAFPIQWDDVLIAQGKEHLIAEVESDERASALFDNMLQG
jgi:uncharacterized phage-associated protein